jgi:hypothetical protein
VPHVVTFDQSDHQVKSSEATDFRYLSDFFGPGPVEMNGSGLSAGLALLAYRVSAMRRDVSEAQYSPICSVSFFSF